MVEAFESMDVQRTGIILKPNNNRVLCRPFELRDEQRVIKIIGRIMEMSDDTVAELLSQVMFEFHGRHHKAVSFFLERFEAVKDKTLTDRPLDERRQMLIGAYFSQEYSLESAALFNPSMVWHPDQSGLSKGSRRFVLSLRATGEGHISSLCFRSGIVDAESRIVVDPPTGFVTPPQVVPYPRYDKALFLRKLSELGMSDGLTDAAIRPLGDTFTMEELDAGVRAAMRQYPTRRREWDPIAKAMLALAKANYEIHCDPDGDISERVIFPYSPTEMNGIEDARWVQFTEDDGSVVYFATYTAFDGSVIFPQLIETTDFLHFRIATLNGTEARNKGMALFPRKINGYYAMLSRQDGENIYIMYSDMPHFWYTKELLLKPTYPWEFVQIGNCGSPIETEAGWLVLSHGVGHMRKYSIGAFLLDRDDPSRVIGRLRDPLLTADENERVGYVPNVVYSCGAQVHNDRLVIPYAMSDFASTFATVPLDQLLAAMEK
jgi:predicted GH43/DUF377 family glycosyl hydrolase